MHEMAYGGKKGLNFSSPLYYQIQSRIDKFLINIHPCNTIRNLIIKFSVSIVRYKSEILY